MNQIATSISRVLTDRAFFEVSGSGEAELVEESYSVTVKGIPQGSVLVKTDLLDSKGFVTGDPYGRRADYALIDFLNDRITFIELKSRNPNHQHVADQLRGAGAVLDYVTTIVRHFMLESIDFANFERRYVLLSNNGGKDSVRKNLEPNDFLILKRRSSVPYARFC